MFINTVKEKLKAGEVAYGCFTPFLNADLVEFVAMQGFDYLVFEGEHGTLSPAQCTHLVRAASLRGTTPIARVPTNQPHIILQYLDTGVHGIHVPQVNSGAEAEQVIQSAKYRPRGNRGLAGTRAADYGMTMTLHDYTQQANEETLTIVHVETVDAVQRIHEFIAIDDLDVIFIGPTDLSQSLGYTGQRNHPEVLNAIDEVIEAVLPSDKALGIYVGSREEANNWRERGIQYISCGLSTIIKSGVASYLG
ncbi:MAG: aldolase/citrate lyase family protein [Chloroflexi bacterium]|nr:aldolase/citrate lyase family protein [Chloroflexota bacterium]